MQDSVTLKPSDLVSKQGFENGELFGDRQLLRLAVDTYLKPHIRAKMIDYVFTSKGNPCEVRRVTLEDGRTLRARATVYNGMRFGPVGGELEEYLEGLPPLTLDPDQLRQLAAQLGR